VTAPARPVTIPAVDDPITVEFVPGWTTWPLRQQVLRPGRPVRHCLYPGEDDPRAVSAAALRRRPGAGELDVLAVGVVLPEAPTWETAGAAPGWRVRGMATEPAARGQGFGTRVLDLLIDHVADHGGGIVWCHARTPALHLYERAGFLARGHVFELDEIGPHQLVGRTVAAR